MSTSPRPFPVLRRSVATRVSAPERRAPAVRSRRRGTGAVPLLIVLLVAACTDRAEPPSAPPPGPVAAPEVTFRTLDGERLVLREARGPTLVSFWSTTCTVCLAEMPDLARLHEDYAPRGFELIAVAMPQDRPDAVLELAEARELPFPVALDIDGQVLAAFEPVVGTPTSYLIDARGQVVERHVGRHDLAALRRSLDALLADRTAALGSGVPGSLSVRPRVPARG